MPEPLLERLTVGDPDLMLNCTSAAQLMPNQHENMETRHPCPETEDKAGKHQKDKEGNKSPCKHTGSLTCRSSTMRGEKEPHLEKPIQTFKASSLSHQVNDTDDLFSFSGPTDTSTPSKVVVGGGHLRTMSSNS